jgi:hypothetical protein
MVKGIGWGNENGHDRNAKMNVMWRFMNKKRKGLRKYYE